MIQLAVDLVILEKDRIYLIKRKNDPFKDFWALPGGFVEYGERVEEAALREAKEETGMDIKINKLIGVFSDPRRDPRGHTVSIVYLAESYGIPRSGSDAKDIKRFKVSQLPQLAFDHEKIIKEAIK
ncbi:MAG: NUDIX hydrolase [Methanomicrobia archaeon]|jgi:8-oxo-dGTP diphosphatase|nr:NUDIX hydrolase [Methanomicrobia archaeon]MCK4309997.1 NUDIX hydrolase [Methanomicrobia archaeon]MCK4637017.1 NUDIX hydrolase [Methanomicrobia archaeon]